MHHCLTPPPPPPPSDPVFVASFSIPDTHSPDDDKVYFFFRERWSESGEEDQRVHSRVARVCKVRKTRRRRKKKKKTGLQPVMSL